MLPHVLPRTPRILGRPLARAAPCPSLPPIKPPVAATNPRTQGSFPCPPPPAARTEEEGGEGEGKKERKRWGEEEKGKDGEGRSLEYDIAAPSGAKGEEDSVAFTAARTPTPSQHPIDYSDVAARPA